MEQFNGKTISTKAVNGGWTTLTFEDGSTQKVRNSALVAKPEPSAPTATTPSEDITMQTQTSKTNGAKPKARKAAKAKAPKVAKPKTPRKPKSDDDKLVPADLSHYVKGKSKTASGRPSLDIDDKAAKQLRGVTLDDAYDVVAREMVSHREELKKPWSEITTISAMKDALHKAYKKLNPGMQRMNLGNRLRGCLGTTRSTAKTH